MAYIIGVQALGFTGAWAYVNSRTRIKATIADLARATYCLGNTALLQRPSPTQRQRAIAAAMVSKGVKVNGSGLCLSPDHFNQDEQIQRTAAFLIGTAIAKLFTEQALNAPWALPIRNLPRAYRVERAPRSGRRLPDLLAHDRRRTWHIVEAKGSATRLPSLAHAKQQTASIRTINGNTPSTRCACLSDLRRDFSLAAHDPEDDLGSLSLEFDPVAYLSAYYGWFTSSSRPRHEEIVGGAGVRARTFSMGEQGFKIGLMAEVIDWIDSSFQGEAPRIRERSGPGFSVGPDGVIIRLYRNTIQGWE